MHFPSVIIVFVLATLVLAATTAATPAAAAAVDGRSAVVEKDGIGRVKIHRPLVENDFPGYGPLEIDQFRPFLQLGAGRQVERQANRQLR